MTTMQKKVMKEFDRLAKKYKMEAVVHHGHVNTGNVCFMSRWDTALVIVFNFQSIYCNLTAYTGTTRQFRLENALWSMPSLDYTNSEGFRLVFRRIEDKLKEFQPQQTSMDI